MSLYGIPVPINAFTQTGAFTEDAVKEMFKHTERPVIFPLSNPTKLSEATAQDLLKWTNGKALIGTGIPYNDIGIDHATKCMTRS
jgi:malic enzyme